MSTTAAPPSPTPSKRKDADVKGVHVGNYQLIKTLGEGSFAKVRLAVHRPTGQQVAIKCIDKNHLPDEYSVRNMYREAQIMKLLDHPNIIKLYEVIETKNEINLVLSYASGGEMLDYIVAHGKLKESEAKKMAAQIVDAMIYCHQANVVHRDLKCENLLLDEDMNIQITDFGLSNVFEAGKKLKTFCGSPVYSAPELIEGIQYTGPEVDVWALGVIVYAMVVGELPFADRNIRLLQQSIVSCRYQVPAFVSEPCKDLLSKMLVVDRKKRLTMAQVRSHPWLKSVPAVTTTFATPAEAIRPRTEHDIDSALLDTLTGMGFERAACIDSILTSKQDQRAATYFLLLHHRLKAEAKKKAALAAASAQTAGIKANPLAFASAGVLPSVTAATAASPSNAAAFSSTDQLPAGDSSAKDKDKNTPPPAKFYMPKGVTAAPTAHGTTTQETSASTLPGVDAGGNVTAAASAPPLDSVTMSPVRRRSRANTVGAIVMPMARPLSVGAEPLNTQPVQAGGGKQAAASAASRRHSPLSTATPISAQASQPPQTESIAEDSGVEPVKPAPTLTPATADAKGRTAATPTPTNGGHHVPSAIQRIISSATTRKRSQTISAGTERPLIRAATSNAAGTAATTSSNSNATNHSQILSVTVVAGETTGSAHSSTMSMATANSQDSTTAIGAHSSASSISSSTSSSGRSKEIRTVRFAFNLLTTTSLQPAEMVTKLQQALRQEDVRFTQDSFTFNCVWTRPQQPHPQDGDVIKFEAEICKVPRLALHGIRLKRVSGDLWEYKRLCTRFMKTWEEQLKVAS